MKKKVKNIIGAILLIAGLVGGTLMVASTLAMSDRAPLTMEKVDENSISVLP